MFWERDQKAILETQIKTGKSIVFLWRKKVDVKNATFKNIKIDMDNIFEKANPIIYLVGAENQIMPFDPSFTVGHSEEYTADGLLLDITAEIFTLEKYKDYIVL